MPDVRKGDPVYCWPSNHEATAERDGSEGLTCAGIVTSVTPSAVHVHYFLPEGSNGMTVFADDKAPPADGPTQGRWWHPPER